MVVGLHRVMHLGIQPGIGQRAGQRPVAGAQAGRGIDPGGRAERVGNGIERHPIHQQPVHGVHGEVRPHRDQCGDGGVFGIVEGSGMRCHRTRIAEPARRISPGDRPPYFVGYLCG